MSQMYVMSIMSHGFPISCAAVLVCEHVALLPQEVELFWKRRVTGATVLILSNRYMSLLSYVVQTASMGIMSEQVCLPTPAVRYDRTHSLLHRGAVLQRG